MPTAFRVASPVSQIEWILAERTARQRRWALALAYAKSGDGAMISGYAGKSEALDDAMAAFAFAYADQTERDY
jgi:hypothetical protein